MTRRKKPRNRNRDALLYDKDDDKPNEMLDHKLAEERARKHREKDAKEEREQRQTSDIKKPKLDKDQDQEKDEERKRKSVTYKSWRWPWEFALYSDDAERSDSADEIVDEARRPKQDPLKRGCPVKDPSPRKGTVEEAMAHYDLDDVAIVEDAEQPPTYELSGSEKEKEIEWVKQKQREQTKSRSEVYDKSMEEEEGRIKKLGISDPLFRFMAVQVETLKQTFLLAIRPHN
ncbi:histone-lysine N-methyltransferase, H3 lysine-79 specific-like [Culex quinquefasciatus]|uniref:histone-lysine N-methyltransferase, H3 lysine-79 specific-like n=1 Tax=Culex quinquefasciatus TaxID=7176 RepID=UPI0018E352D0|nr:histone-lysine N-methyltransferase, H3 lysine-79 specific-like [Culex quinquefasciatus]